MMKRFFYVVAVALLLVSCATSSQQQTPAKKMLKAPKYVFYFIGDGYGPAQAHLAEQYLANKKGKMLPDTLLMNTFPVHGVYTTYAENRFITGSAAAGTALASGHKTTIKTICMSGNHAVKYKSMAEILRDRGMKVGIVTSVSIDHATPAVFYAHQPHRNNYYEIATELPESRFNYFAGGGFKDAKGEKRGNKSALANMGIGGDEVNANATQVPSAYTIAEQLGYRFVNTKSEFANLKNGDDKIVVFDPKPASGASIPYVIDQTDENFTLVDFTKKGIELLDNPKGFFMMVEGGKIDWACHANDAASAALEVLQFDEAIKEAYKFYQQHPEETLIVICSDHETGGLTLGFAGSHYDTNFQLLTNQKCSSEAFSHKIVAYKKQHPYDASFEGIYPMLKEDFGFDTSDEMKLTPYEIEDLTKALKDLDLTYEERTKDQRLECGYGPYNPVAVVATRILQHKAGLDFTTYSHTALPCPARAIGVGADVFYGKYDNTEIPQKIMKMYGVELK